MIRECAIKAYTSDQEKRQLKRKDASHHFLDGPSGPNSKKVQRIDKKSN
jgi:hypothetical protein